MSALGVSVLNAHLYTKIILIRRDYFDRCFVNLTGGFDFAKFGHFTGLESRLFITRTIDCSTWSKTIIT